LAVSFPKIQHCSSRLWHKHSHNLLCKLLEIVNNPNGRIVLRKAMLTDSKSKGGHLGYPSFPVMYKFVIPVIVIPMILHFKRLKSVKQRGDFVL